MDKLRLVKCMKSKLYVYPDVRNTEVTHSILNYWINVYFIEDQQYLFTYIPLANKDMFHHENMTCYHVYFFHILS